MIGLAEINKLDELLREIDAERKYVLQECVCSYKHECVALMYNVLFNSACVPHKYVCSIQVCMFHTGVCST